MTQRASRQDIEAAAREFLAAVGRPEAFEDYNHAIDLVRENGETGWDLILAAVAQATNQSQLDAIGAALIEDLLQSFAATFVDRVVERIGSDPSFAAAAAIVRMTGLPREVWERINGALIAAGVDEKRLVDWSTISPVARGDG